MHSALAEAHTEAEVASRGVSGYSGAGRELLLALEAAWPLPPPETGLDNRKQLVQGPASQGCPE